MHLIPGTWHVEFELNGEVILDMYPEVVATLDPTFNRPPASIDLSIQPSTPEEDDVINCSVLSSLTLDDPDRDLVRYRYQWKVNNVIVRDVISASMRDVLQKNLAWEGDVVSISVTPNDGSLDGEPKISFVTIAPMSSGACCLVSGGCEHVPADTCVSLGGVFQGSGVLCKTNPCNPKEMRACCFGESCTLMTEADCISAGGKYHDEFASCAGIPCIGGDPTGACCLPVGSCIDLMPDVCEYVGGKFQGSGVLCGDGSLCDKIPCDADINGDDYVNVGDLLTVIDQWGLTNSPADINDDGIVDVSDLLLVVGDWGPCE